MRRSRYPPHDIGVLTMLQSPPSVFSPCVLLLCFLKINRPRRRPQAYPSLKPLASWVTDLLQRINFMHEWISDGIPSVYWISGFFFPQAFLTGTLQNYARRSKYSIDTIGLDFKVSRRSRRAVWHNRHCYVTLLTRSDFALVSGGAMCQRAPRKHLKKRWKTWKVIGQTFCLLLPRGLLEVDHLPKPVSNWGGALLTGQEVFHESTIQLWCKVPLLLISSEAVSILLMSCASSSTWTFKVELHLQDLPAFAPAKTEAPTIWTL